MISAQSLYASAKFQLIQLVKLDEHIYTWDITIWEYLVSIKG